MKTGLAFAALLLSSTAPAALTTLDFEGLAHNVNLTTQYASLGATFTSTDTFSSIRNTPGFESYPARSGQTVVTTKTLGLTTIAFSHNVDEVSVWVLSPQTFGAKLTAYGAGGGVVATATNPTNAAYRQLRVLGVSAAIRSVTIQAPAGFAVIDDLSFTAAPVPEPASLATLGLGAFGLLRRRLKG